MENVVFIHRLCGVILGAKRGTISVATVSHSKKYLKSFNTFAIMGAMGLGALLGARG